MILTMEEYKVAADKFLKWFSGKYMDLKRKYFKLCVEKKWTFDEDVFSDTYLKVYESILKRGIKDDSEKGFENYLFMAFRNNTLNEKRRWNIKYRDNDFDTEKLSSTYEKWYNRTHDSEKKKIVSDMFNDFSILYIMTLVEDNFDDEHFYLFRIKTMCNMKYKELAQKTNILSARLKVIEVIKWLKENVTKEEIKAAFWRTYGNIIED